MSEVYIEQVNMVKCENDCWDAHVTVKSKDPTLNLGEFVVDSVASAEDMKARLQPAFDAFLGSLKDKTFGVTH